MLRAIAAGLALQEACRKLSVAGMADLKMRVTLAQGEVWVALLAKGLAAREPVICGDVFDRFRSADRFRDGVLVGQPFCAHVAAAAVSPRATVAMDAVGVRVMTLDWRIAGDRPFR